MNLIGVGLRPPHFSEFKNGHPASVGWVQVITENYLPWQTFTPTSPLERLLKVREHTPVSIHGVSLNIASNDELSTVYLKHLKKLILAVQPISVSDHLCWTGVNAKQSHDLLPFPHRKDFLEHIVKRVDQVQETLGRKILLENVSAYVSFQDNEMSEAQFLAELSKRTGCGVLLDVNNIYVSSINQKFDALQFLSEVKHARVEEYHLAGFEEEDGILIDTHGAPVHEPVWELFRKTIQILGPRPTLLERDTNIPSWTEMEGELKRIGDEYAKLI